MKGSNREFILKKDGVEIARLKSTKIKFDPIEELIIDTETHKNIPDKCTKPAESKKYISVEEVRND